MRLEGNLVAIDKHQRDKIDDYLKSAEFSVSKEWYEKFRRFICLYANNLTEISKIRFGSDWKDQLKWMREHLVNAVSLSSGEIDAAMLNAILYADDCLKNTDSKEVQEMLKTLELQLKQKQPRTNNTYLGAIPDYSQDMYSPHQKPGLVIFAPSPYSLFAQMVFHLLIQRGMKPELIIVRSFSFSRILAEVRRDGIFRIVKKIWRKLIIRGNENSAPDSFGIKELASATCCNINHLEKSAARYGVPYLSVREFGNCDSYLADLSPKIGLFTGGGLLRKRTLEQFSIGVINSHMGALPEYRGMDVVEAAILSGDFRSVGITTHIMVPELDAGAVALKHHINSDCYPSLAALRNEISAIQPVVCVLTAMGLLDDRVEKIEQQHKGRQYYFIHVKLRGLLQRIMNERYKQSAPGRLNWEVLLDFASRQLTRT